MMQQTASAQEPHGMVTINDEPDKRSLLKFCRKKIAQWLRDNGGGNEAAGFNVAIIEDHEAKQIACVTEIKLGGTLWRGYDLDQNMQRAFLHSMKRLQPH